MSDKRVAAFIGALCLLAVLSYSDTALGGLLRQYARFIWWEP